MSAPRKPLSDQRADKACARALAADAVQHCDLFGQQPDLDRDPALIACALGGDLGLATFGHGNPQRKTAPERAARLGDQRAFGAGLAAPACGLFSILGVSREGVEIAPDRFSHQERDLQPCRFSASLNLLDQVHRAFVCIGHLHLHCSDPANIWGPHTHVNGAPITIFAEAA